jgi:hypothetical protein
MAHFALKCNETNCASLGMLLERRIKDLQDMNKSTAHKRLFHESLDKPHKEVHKEIESI